MTSFAFFLPTVLALANCLLLVLLVFGPRLGVSFLAAPQRVTPIGSDGTARPDDVTKSIEERLAKISEDIDWLTTDRMIEVTRTLAEPGTLPETGTRATHGAPREATLRLAVKPGNHGRLSQ